MTVHGRRVTGALMVGMVLGLGASLAWADDAAQPPDAAATRLPRKGAVRMAHQGQAAAQDTAAKAPAGNRLALQAPPLEHLYPRQQLRYIMADPGPDDDSLRVEVEKQKAAPLVPMGQLYAVPWAFLHPTQAWRILTPVVAP